MVDREVRDKLASLIEAYLNEDIASFAFEDELDELAGKTVDRTVRHVSHALWFHYDSVKDHTVVLSKEEWDYFQRLLLLVKSSAVVGVEPRRIWSWSQLGAAVALVGLIIAVCRLSPCAPLLALAVVAAIVSSVLSRMRPELSKQEAQAYWRRAPFGSIAEILAVRRTVSGFRKQPHPTRLVGRRIRSAILEWEIPDSLYRFVLSPFFLLQYMFPVSRESTRVYFE